MMYYYDFILSVNFNCYWFEHIRHWLLLDNSIEKDIKLSYHINLTAKEMNNKNRKVEKNVLSILR